MTTSESWFLSPYTYIEQIAAKGASTGRASYSVTYDIRLLLHPILFLSAIVEPGFTKLMA